MRLLGLDVFDLELSTDGTTADDDPGDSTATAAGFTLPQAPPLEVVMPEWR
jgi:hypothetical protein